MMARNLEKLLPLAGAGLIALAIFQSSKAKAPTGLVIPGGSVIITAQGGHRRAFRMNSPVSHGQGASHSDTKLKRPGDSIRVTVGLENSSTDTDGNLVPWPFKVIVSPLVGGVLGEAAGFPTMKQKERNFDLGAGGFTSRDFFYSTPTFVGKIWSFQVRLQAAPSDPNGVALKTEPFINVDEATAGTVVEVVSGGVDEAGGLTVSVSQGRHG